LKQSEKEKDFQEVLECPEILYYAFTVFFHLTLRATIILHLLGWYSCMEGAVLWWMVLS